MDNLKNTKLRDMVLRRLKGTNSEKIQPEEGEKVKCIRPDDVNNTWGRPLNLTRGKLYVPEYFTATHVCLLNDTGMLETYYIDRFELGGVSNEERIERRMHEVQKR